VTLVELHAVNKAFDVPGRGTVNVLRDVELMIGVGEVISIVGRSGSGKSTLLNILGLLDQPTSGSCLLDGIETRGLNDRDRARRRATFIGFIFQQFFLLDRRTALENVAEPLLYGTLNGVRNRMVRAAVLLEQVGLADRGHSMPHLLSGGEQQRVAIARALARNPRLILADEPTGALDLATGRLVLDLLLDLVRMQGTSMILVTHEPDVAARADRTLTIVEGRLEEIL
jgi:putative ABC transport system ATP-binding protein